MKKSTTGPQCTQTRGRNTECVTRLTSIIDHASLTSVAAHKDVELVSSVGEGHIVNKWALMTVVHIDTVFMAECHYAMCLKR